MVVDENSGGDEGDVFGEWQTQAAGEEEAEESAIAALEEPEFDRVDFKISGEG
jgi:hypothetical protein